MNKITFKSLKIEGYGSFVKPQFFVLDRPGINLVFGENGEGKTTIFSALCWILFKFNLKGLTNSKVVSWDWVRDSEWQGTRGVVNFSVDEDTYIIARHIAYKGETFGIKGADKLIIVKNGTMLGDEMYKGDQQAFIEDLLGMNDKIFTNSILFGQRMKRLVSASNEEKRQLLETTFDAGWIQDSKDKVYAELNTVAARLQRYDNEIILKNNKHTSIFNEWERGNKILKDFEATKIQDVDKLVLEKTNFQQKLKVAITDLQKAEEALAAELTDVSLEETELASINESIVGYQQQVKELEETINQYASEIKKSEGIILSIQTKLNDLKDTCPVCEQAIKNVNIKGIREASQVAIDKEKQVIATLNEKVLEFTPEIENLSTLISNANQRKQFINTILEAAEEVKKKHKNLSNEIIRLQTSISYINESITKCDDDIANVELRKPPVIDLDGMQSQMDQLEEEVALIDVTKEIDLKYYNHLKFWDTKGFGSAGLKAFIFNAMLENLNNSVGRYASRLGVSVRFSVDTSKARGGFQTLCLKEGQEVDYQELSGGEQQRVDICLAFAFHDMVSYKSNINILIMDEIFENVDARGIETIFDLIRVKAGDNKSVYCITHLTSLDTLNAKSIFVKKENNISSID